LINNRQGGRRRGRGGQGGGGRNLGGQPGNRQDNRQRGNAAQLLEKYKSMARDAQLAGDRVQTEYFLQFADHYFRLLSENRARFEDQRPRRDHDFDDDDGDDEMIEAGDDSAAGDERPERAERAERTERTQRPERAERSERYSRPRREEPGAREAAEDDRGQANGARETIPFDVLPPAIGRDEEQAPEDSDEGPRRPRRRARTPRPEAGDEEIVPAA
jgi:hypothetical protein